EPISVTPENLLRSWKQVFKEEANEELVQAFKENPNYVFEKIVLKLKIPVYRKGDKILYTGIYMQTTLQGWKCRTKNSGICGYREYYTVSAPGGVIAAICR